MNAVAALPRPGCCSCELHKTVVAVSVVVAVAGLAAAIFTSQLFAAVGFALFGASSLLLGVWGASHDARLDKLKKALGQDAARFEEGNRKIAALTLQLAQQQAVFAQERVALQGQVDRFQQQNALLADAQRRLEADRLRLHEENQHLLQTKAALEAALAQLKLAQEGIKAQVQEFLALNLQMGRHVGAFQQGGAQLAQTEQELQGAVGALDARFDENIGQLANHLQLGKAAIQGIVGFIEENQQKKKAEVLDLQQVVHQLKEAEALWREQEAHFQEEQEAVHQKVVAAEALKRSFDEIEERLSKQQQEIAQQTLLLKEEGVRIGQEAVRLEAVQKQIEDLQRQAQTNVAALDKLVLGKQQTLSAINKKIGAALAQLKTYRARLPQA